MNARCYACDREPASGDWSEEHIIPNALGGRWKSSRLLCRTCNSKFGAEVDAVLGRELGGPMNMLGIRRGRGAVPNQLVRLPSGATYLRDADGNMQHCRPVIREEVRDGQVTIDIQGRDRRQIRKALQGLARKHPGKFDVDERVSALTNQRLLQSSPTYFEVGVGGDRTFRAIAKIAIGAFIAWGGSRHDVLACLDYVRGCATGGPYAGWFYQSDVMGQRLHAEVTHAVAVRAEPGQTAWAYVELFRAFRFAVCLSEHYSGPRVCRTYVYDLLGQRETVDRDLVLAFADVDLAVPGLNVDALREHLAVLMRVAEKRSREGAIGSSIKHSYVQGRIDPSCATTQDCSRTDLSEPEE